MHENQKNGLKKKERKWMERLFLSSEMGIKVDDCDGYQ